MSGVRVEKEATLENYQGADVSALTFARACDSYPTVKIAKNTAEFEAADFTAKVKFKGHYVAGSQQIHWSWTVGEITIIPKENLSPTIKAYYDENKAAEAPAMDTTLSDEIQGELISLLNSQQNVIKTQIKQYLNYSGRMVYRTQAGADEVSRIISAYAPMKTVPQTYPSITIPGKLFIRPSLVTASTTEDSFKLQYSSPVNGLKKLCEYTTCLLAEDRVNFVMKLDPVATGADQSYWDTTFGESALNGFVSARGSVEAQYVASNNLKEQTLMEAYSAGVNAARTAQLLSQWIAAHRTYRTPIGDGWLKFGLTSTARGIGQFQIIIPFGEGGLYFQSTTVYVTLNPVNLAAEINYWQQFAARVREFQENRAAAYNAWIIAQAANVPPATNTTPVTLNPEVPIDTTLPVSPEVITAPENTGGAGRPVGDIFTPPDFSDFFIDQGIFWNAINGGGGGNTCPPFCLP